MTPNHLPQAGRRPPIEALGQSEAFLTFQERLSKVARVDRPVLLIGERGTGKELAVAKLHYLSGRWQGSLIALNCSALMPSLIESELFGYEAGAFTGAARRRTGRFEAADEGTLFLDEIADIPLEVQEKILRVVEYGTFERVGSSVSVTVDARIIGATNKDLPHLVQKGLFKQDLLDRLSFEVLYVPPLRDRKGDIRLLASHFAARMAFEMGLEKVPEFRESALISLEQYPWPGNVRELKNVVERAVYHADGGLVAHVVFDPFYTAARPKSFPDQEDEATSVPPEKARKPFEEIVEELKVRLIRNALAESRFNQRTAAERLGLTYHQFRGLYRKYIRELET